ncbi:MAG: hypothetical protein KDB02_06665 [Acidimicrobiales bacterium]|nr:hypothetical protein [Acidimicrobiales bacterium]
MELRRAAEDVLRLNDRGGWTRPSPALYPHQWSWDAAFIAIGWAHLDVDRAVAELEHLFEAQWDTGMVPHIVFDPTVPQGSYEPAPQRWGSEAHSPTGVLTSSICQPPVHAMALQRIVEIAGREHPAIRRVLPELLDALRRWHRWLRTARDPDGTALVTILHPWESGMDNSPRWDEPLSALPEPPVQRPHDAFPCGVAPSTVQNHRGKQEPVAGRPDLGHVADPSERPTDLDYARYMALVESLASLDHDQATAMKRHPFRVRDVWFSAILAAADESLAALFADSSTTGAEAEAKSFRADAARTREALARSIDGASERCLDFDLSAHHPITSDTVAAFAPLLAGTESVLTDRLVDRLWSPHSAGNPALVHPLPPSTAVDDPSFDARRYWRGPQWPPITWLLWNGLVSVGRSIDAEGLRRSAVDQLLTVGCCEYVDPLTGDPLGSESQSWTAAVALDWLCAAR